MKIADEKDAFTDELPPGTELLHGQYTIRRYLNVGGFGLTYLAHDSLDRTVVLKECYPGSLCTRTNNIVHARSRSHQAEFKAVVKMFVQEARRLAKLNHPNIVGVHQVFEDNETAYMSLDYVEGLDLLDIVERDRDMLSPAQVQNILSKVLDAVAFIHDKDILHRDISPDNIILDRTGSPVLIDFGAARERATRASRVLSALQVVKDGYSPQEFYVAGSTQGPPGDLYALGATFYHVITGDPPPNAQVRLAALAANNLDPYKHLAGRTPGYDDHFLAAIDKALNVFPADRFQSAREWEDYIDKKQRYEEALQVARRDMDIQRSIQKLVAETNRAVREARRQDELRKAEEAAKPKEEKKKEPFFKWQLEDDWLIGHPPEEEEQPRRKRSIAPKILRPSDDVVAGDAPPLSQPVNQHEAEAEARKEADEQKKREFSQSLRSKSGSTRPSKWRSWISRSDAEKDISEAQK